MKTEGDSQPQPIPPVQSYTPQPQQWSPIPIDPALQQTQQQTHYQHYSYSAHYPQSAYPTHYQPYGAQPVAPQVQAPPPVIARPPVQTSVQSSSGGGGGGGGVDTSDLATLNDALGSAGVDLRAEEESLQRGSDSHLSYRSYEDRTRKQPPKPSFDIRHLSPSMSTIATQHKITRIPDDSINYVALALRARLQDLITGMIAAAHHRTDTQFDRPASLYDDGTPMWGILVRSDVAKQLAALEKVEREEETRVRRERKERADMAAAHAAALAAQAAGTATPGGGDGSFEDGEGGSAKKKRKKEGPGVTARNMSEDVRKKMSNAVASQAAGLGGKYAWMNASNAAATPKPKAAAASSSTGGGPMSTSPATTTTPVQAAGGSWARPYVPTKKSATSTSETPAPTEDDTRLAITLRDAMFVVEKERGHGGGRGAARGWT